MWLLLLFCCPVEFMNTSNHRNGHMKSYKITHKITIETFIFNQPISCFMSNLLCIFLTHYHTIITCFILVNSWGLSRPIFLSTREGVADCFVSLDKLVLSREGSWFKSGLARTRCLINNVCTIEWLRCHMKGSLHAWNIYASRRNNEALYVIIIINNNKNKKRVCM